MWPTRGHPVLWDCVFTSGLLFYILGYQIATVKTAPETLPTEQESCAITPVFQDSPFIRAFKEVTEDGHGCFSNQTINGMEVHVIYLDNHLKHNTDVYLEIITNHKDTTHQPQFIFILSSRKQITWKIRLPNLKFTSGKHLIVTHLRSAVRFNKKVDYVDINKRGDFPTRAKTLFKWVNAKYHAITSFTKFKAGTRLIRAHVGPVSNAPGFCNTQKKMDNPHASIIAYVPISFGGCAVANNDDNSFRTIHIIEVTGSKGSPLNEIIVELRPHNGKNPNVDILLVLKASDSNVVWVIRSRKIMGELEISSNNRVNTDRVMMQKVAQRKEKLYASGLELVSWVKVHTTGFVSSYTNVTRVDRFTLSVEGTSLDQSSNVERPEKPDKKTNMPTVAISPFANPSKTKADFQAAMQTSCFPDGLVVFINSSLAKKYGLTREQITLADSMCQAEEINEYYVLRSGYSQCDTVTHKSFAVKYSNQLQILPISEMEQPLPNPPKVTQPEGSGNGRDGSYSEDGSGSGHLIPVDDTHEDDEDFPPQKIALHFSCSPRKKINPKLRFHLDFYDDPLYKNHYNKFPFYSTKEKFIYVQAKVSGDHLYGVQLTDCSLTEDGRKIQPLLRNGCPVAEGSFSWQTNKQPGIQEFSFKVNPHVSENKIHHISCRMTACAKDIKLESGTWRTRQCIHPAEFCSKFKKLQSLESGHHNFVNVISKGSFIVYSMKSHTRNHGLLNGGRPIQTGKQVIIQGLESGTVIGIAFSAFIIGVLLTATLWFIQVYTDPQKREAKRKKGGSTTETSADSTPCSFSPISV